MSSDSAVPEPGREAGNSCPLSAAQRGFWLVQGVTGGGAGYHIVRWFRLRGAGLRPDLLAGAVSAVVARHEVLRTSFHLDGSTVTGCIGMPYAVPWKQQDFSGQSAGEQERAWREFFRLAASEPFDLGTPVRVRGAVARLGPAEHVLLLCFHHSAMDGVTLRTFCRELSDIYAAAREGRTTENDAAPTQYRDFATWEENLQRQADWPAHVEYWRQTLAGAPELEWPVPRRREPDAGLQASLYEFTLDARVLELLERRWVRPKTSRFMVLLAAYAVLLHRHTRQSDFVVGAPMSPRLRAEFRDLLGSLMTVVPLRVSLEGDPTFGELLQRVSRTVLSARDHARVPLEAIVSALGLNRADGVNPVFRTILTVQGDPVIQPALEGIEVCPVTEEIDTAHLEFSLELRPNAGGMTGLIRYRRALFDDAFVGGMAARFLRLLEELGRDTDRPISEVPMLQEGEREALLELGRGPEASAGDLRLHAGFEASVARVPDAIALIEGGRHTSYRELDALANQLALWLGSHGVGRGAVVGVVVRRSTEFVASILAVLKAGGAFLSLDPAFPRDRIAWALRQANARALIRDGTGSGAEPLPGRPVFDWTRDRDALREAGDVPKPVPEAAGAEDLAYVICTSGTTGTPRLVAVEHRSAANVVAHSAAELAGPEDLARVAFAHAVSFDACVHQVFLTLHHGGALVVLDSLSALGGSPWYGEVTWMGGTAGVVGALLDDAGVPPALRGVVLGAEPFQPGVVQRLTAAPGLQRVLNLYGPTETAIYSSCQVVWSRDRAAQESQPGTRPTGREIGRPIRGTRLYVLDGRGEPVPVGVVGELFVSGIGVARGYLGVDPAADSPFGMDPFRPASERVRLYRTGDRVRWMADGTLEFIGRLDRQVKLRGMRIDLDEVESVLSHHPAVAVATVQMEEERGESRRLVAFVVPGAEGVGEEALRAFARARLPAGHVPAVWVFLQRLPLTRHGKVDRAALPWPVTGGPGSVHSGTPKPPGSALEARIRAAWEEVLERDDFGTDDNFFFLGGDSLRAMRLAQRLGASGGEPKDRGMDVSLVFRAPTIREQVAALSENSPAVPRTGGDAAPRIVPLQSRGLQTPLLFVNGGLNLWRLSRLLGPDQPSFALQLNYGLEALEARRQGERVPQPAFGELADRYLQLLRDRWPQGPYRLAGFCFGGLLAQELARRLSAAGESVEGLVLLDVWVPGRRFTGRDRLELELERWGRWLGTSPSRWGDRIRGWFRERARVRGLQALAESRRPSDDAASTHGLLIHLNREMASHAARSHRPARFEGPALVIDARPAGATRYRRRLSAENAERVRSLLVPRARFESLDCAHDALFDPPAVERVAERLSGFLRESTPGHQSGDTGPGRG